MEPISANRLETHVYKLAGEIGEHNIYHPRALNAAASYICQEWRQQGYEVIRHSYTVESMECANLEITSEGSNQDGDIILIGAHYDSVMGSPGANDNGSGIAALLELSRLFINAQHKKTVRFVAFANEEPPFFYWNNMGSMVYAKQAKKHHDKIIYMISLETIGYYDTQPASQHYPPILKHFYPQTGNFIAFVSNLRSRRTMLQAVKAFRAATNFPVEHIATLAAVPGVSWSDHLSFWRQGYKAFMITDTAFYRYPYYHSSEDTPEKLMYEPFAKMTNGLYLMLLSLVNK
jgi:Zn-dependent M28 family amino/carboxypeptidase